jgi:hypothetical protein
MFSLCSGGNPNVLNDKKQAALHLATELNKVKVLKLMIRYKDITDLRLGGEHGRTALHLAAIYDHDECARILVRTFFILYYFTRINPYTNAKRGPLNKNYILCKKKKKCAIPPWPTITNVSVNVCLVLHTRNIALASGGKR